MPISFRALLRAGAMLGALGVGLAGTALADPIPQGWEAKDFKPVGYTGLGGKPGGFKMAIKKVGEGASARWYMYLGHFWDAGWSIVDVTKPEDPKFVKFIPGPDNTQTTQVSLHGNLMITGLARPGGERIADPNKPSE